MGHLVKLSYPEAPSGTFAITTHGTNTPGVAYSDFDCTTVMTSRSLNSAGRATFYVTALVDVVVSNASGTAVDSFSEGISGALVNASSPNWTGTLANGTQGLGGQLSLTEVQAELAESFGANNGYVRATGQVTDRLLKDELASIRSANFPYYNVKDAAYGALGDDANDDGPAIQAAISAAASGGVVFFPPGTYRISGGIAITIANVSLQGASSGASRIRYMAAAGYAVTISLGGAASRNEIADLGIMTDPAGGLALQCTSAPGVTVRRCDFDQISGLAFDAPAGITTNSRIVFENNSVGFDCTTASRGVIEVTDSSAASGSLFALNRFDGQTDAASGCIRITAGGAAGSLRYIGNSSDNATLGHLVQAAAGLNHVCSGNSVVAGVVIASSLATANIFETASSTQGISGMTAVEIGTSPYTGTVSSTSRDRSLAHSAGTTFTIDPTLAEDQTKDVNGSPVTVGDPGGMWNGCPLQLRIRNTTAGAVTVNWDAAFLGSGAMGTIAANATRVVRWVRRESGASTGWRYAGHWDGV